MKITRFIFLLLVALFSTGIVIAYDDDNEDDDPMISPKAAVKFCEESHFKHLEMEPYSLKNIKASVLPELEKDSYANQCDFTLSEAEIRNYLKNAYVFTGGFFYEYTDTHPCIISGEIEQNGKITKWEINSSSSGFINRGAPNEIKLWCPQC